MTFFAPLIADIYSTPILEEMLCWVALTFIISPWGSQFRARFQKHLNFKPLAIVDILAVTTGSLLSVSLAWIGLGVWALIWGLLTQYIIINISLTILAWRYGMLPRKYFNLKESRPYLSFGLRLLGSNIINYFNSRVDQLLIGIILGPQALGYYSMAFNLVLQPVSKINPVLTQVGFPILARVKNDTALLKKGYFRMLDLLTSINAPLLLGFAAIAPILIPFILGQKWNPIIDLVQILAIFSLIRSTGNAGGSLILASGRADLALYWNILLFLFIPLAILIGATLGGLIGVAVTLLLLQLCLIIVWYLIIVRRLLLNCFWEYISSIFKSILTAVPMVACVNILHSIMLTTNSLIKLILEVSAGMVIYITLNLYFRREFVIKNLKLLFGKY